LTSGRWNYGHAPDVELRAAGHSGNGANELTGQLRDPDRALSKARLDLLLREACERFNLPLETWTRQESAFGLLKKVYARRAQLRGQQPLNATSSFHAAPLANGEEKNAAPTGDDKSAVAPSQPTQYIKGCNPSGGLRVGPKTDKGAPEAID
jgi:hypothetical protein